MTSTVFIDTHLGIDIPAAMHCWIDCDTPITYKLIERTGDAQLELLYQGWTKVNWWGVHYLHLDAQKVFQRDIVMRSHGTVYWYARGLIPESCYELEPDFFKRLEHESIRNLIYDEPKVKRVQRTAYAINEQCIEFHWIKKYIDTQSDHFFVRITEYSFKNEVSFYLIELFFPELLQL